MDYARTLAVNLQEKEEALCDLHAALARTTAKVDAAESILAEFRAMAAQQVV